MTGAPGTGGGGDAGHPRRLQSCDVLADLDRALSGDVAAVGRLLQRRRQRIDEVVDAHGQPGLGEHVLHLAGEARPTRAGPALDEYDSGRHSTGQGICLHDPAACSSSRCPFFDPAAKTAGLEDLSSHDLRHTAASLLVASGANVKAVQRMLGHASAAMTLDVYSGLFDDDLGALAERMDAAHQASVTRHHGT